MHILMVQWAHEFAEEIIEIERKAHGLPRSDKEMEAHAQRIHSIVNLAFLSINLLVEMNVLQHGPAWPKEPEPANDDKSG